MNLLLNFIKRGLLMAWAGPAAFSIIIMLHQADETGMATGIIFSLLAAFIIAGSSVVYRIEVLTPVEASLIHLAVITLCVLSFCRSGICADFTDPRLFIIALILIYALIRMADQLVIAHKVKKINRRLRTEDMPASGNHIPTGIFSHPWQHIPAIIVSAAIIITGITVPSGSTSNVNIYAASTHEEITQGKDVTVKCGTIDNNGITHGEPVSFYLKGSGIDKVRFSCKENLMDFEDSGSLRESYYDEKNFTVKYGKNLKDYSDLIIYWNPKAIIDALSSKKTTVRTLPDYLKHDTIVLQITYTDGRTETKALKISLDKDGIFSTSFGSYSIKDSDSFVNEDDALNRIISDKDLILNQKTITIAGEDLMNGSDTTIELTYNKRPQAGDVDSTVEVRAGNRLIWQKDYTWLNDELTGGLYLVHINGHAYLAEYICEIARGTGSIDLNVFSFDHDGNIEEYDSDEAGFKVIDDQTIEDVSKSELMHIARKADSYLTHATGIVYLGSKDISYYPDIRYTHETFDNLAAYIGRKPGKTAEETLDNILE